MKRFLITGLVVILLVGLITAQNKDNNGHGDGGNDHGNGNAGEKHFMKRAAYPGDNADGDHNGHGNGNGNSGHGNDGHENNGHGHGNGSSGHH